MFASLRPAILTAFAFLGTQAAANTLTFDDPYTGTTYTEAGMTIESVAGSEVTLANGRWNLPCCPSGDDKYELTTGGTFDFLSIDIFHSDPGDPITFTGYSGATKIAETVIDLYDAGFWEFTGFIGIDLLTIEVTGMYTDPVFDNLTYNPATPVPLPAGGALLISGVVALGALRARKRAT